MSNKNQAVTQQPKDMKVLMFDKITVEINKLFDDDGVVQFASAEEAIQAIQKILLDHNFSLPQAERIAPDIYSHIKEASHFSFLDMVERHKRISERLQEGQDIDDLGDSLLLTSSDIDWLQTNLRTEYNLNIVLLLTAFAAYARSHPHHSDWIHYDKKEIFALAGQSITRLPVKDQEALTKELHDKYNLAMQVVGSMQPIPCYKLEWQQPVTPQSPLQSIGDYSSQSLFSYVLRNIYTTQPQQKGGSK